MPDDSSFASASGNFDLGVGARTSEPAAIGKVLGVQSELVSIFLVVRCHGKYVVVEGRWRQV